MRKMSIALQVFSIREEAEKDFRGTMKQVKEMGYDGVELAGLYNYSPEEIRDILAETGLKPISAHVPYQTLIADMEGTIRQYVTIGCPYIVIPYLTEEHRPGCDNFDEVIENIKKIGKLCKEQNVVLLYHNHDFEFIKMNNGQYGLDYLYEKVAAEYLQTEIDTCWVGVSGLDPAEYVKKYTGRAPIVHLKDYVGKKSDHMYELIGIASEKKESEEFAFRAVGSGVQNFPAILKAADEAGADWVVVEQDMHDQNTALEDARISILYLKTIGL